MRHPDGRVVIERFTPAAETTSIHREPRAALVDGSRSEELEDVRMETKHAALRLIVTVDDDDVERADPDILKEALGE